MSSFVQTLDRLFELICPSIQTVMSHQNHVEVFLAHTQSPEIVNYDIIFALSEQPLFSGPF